MHRNSMKSEEWLVVRGAIAREETGDAVQTREQISATKYRDMKNRAQQKSGATSVSRMTD